MASVPCVIWSCICLVPRLQYISVPMHCFCVCHLFQSTNGYIVCITNGYIQCMYYIELFSNGCLSILCLISVLSVVPVVSCLVPPWGYNAVNFNFEYFIATYIKYITKGLDQMHNCISRVFTLKYYKIHKYNLNTIQSRIEQKTHKCQTHKCHYRKQST